MIFVNGFTVTGLLSTIISHLFASSKTYSVVIISDSSARDITEDIIRTITHQSGQPAYIINDDVLTDTNRTRSPLRHQGFFVIFLIDSIESISKFVTHYINNHKYFHQSDNGLIVMNNKYSTYTTINEILPNLLNDTAINIGIVFFDTNYAEIYAINILHPLYLKFISNITERFSENAFSLDKIFNEIYNSKKHNLNRRNLTVLIGLDMGNIYKKINPRRNEDELNIGGHDIYLVELIGQLLNASLTYKLQDISAIISEKDTIHLQFLQNFVGRPVELSYDNSEPLTIELIKSLEENGYIEKCPSI